MKNEINKQKYEDLADWLGIATKRLCADAKIRITAEILAHYQEAVEGGLKRGDAEEEAQRAAVRALGDPKLANKKFRRTYLTPFQDKMFKAAVKNEIHKSIWIFFSVWGLFTVLPLLALLAGPLDKKGIAFLFQMFCAGGFFSIMMWPITYSSFFFRHLSTRTALAWYITGPTVGFFGYWMSLFWETNRLALGLPLVVCMFACGVILFGPLWLKLGRKP